MPRPLLFTVEASPDAVRDTAQRVLGFTLGPDRQLVGQPQNWADTSARLRLEARSAGADSTEVELHIENPTHVPYWDLFLGPFLRRGERHTLQHEGARIAAAIEGRPPPPAPRRRAPLLPPVPFAPQAVALLATVAAISALANFGGALFGQTADSVTDTFGASTKALGVSLAVSRGGGHE